MHTGGHFFFRRKTEIIMSGPKDSRISVEEMKRRELERRRREELERKRREAERRRLEEEARRQRVKDLRDNIAFSSRELDTSLGNARNRITVLKSKIVEFGVPPTAEYQKLTRDVETVAREIVTVKGRNTATENERELRDILVDFQKVADKFRRIMDDTPRVADSITAAYTEKLTSEIADLAAALAREEKQRRETENQERIRKAAEESRRKEEKLREEQAAALAEISVMEEAFRKTVAGREAPSELQDEIDTLENVLHTVEKGGHNAEYLRSFAAISLEPRLRDIGKKLTDYENLKQEYGALSDEYLAVCQEAGVPPKTFPVSKTSINFMKAEIDVIHQTLAKRDAERYIGNAINEVMEEMGYHLMGGLRNRPAGIVKSGLYRFNDSTAVNVTYDSNGDMCMELGALDTEDREPDVQEAENLRRDMESFCTGYRKIREKLAEKGLVIHGVSELPPDAEYAQVFNLSDFNVSEEDFREAERNRRSSISGTRGESVLRHLSADGESR